MKQKQKNNPIVAGALMAILAGVLGMTVVRMREVMGPTIALTPASSEPSAAAAPPAAESPSTASAETTSPAALKPERDPFFHPRLREQHKAEEARALAAGSAAAPTWPGITPHPLGLSPFPVEPLKPMTPAAERQVSPASPLPDGRAGAAPLTFDPEIESMSLLRLTAVFLSGAQPRAIVEGAGSRALTVNVGDKIGALTVMAIHTNEIVLRGTRGFWTLPIQASEAAPPSEGASPQKEEPNHGDL